MKPSQSLPSQAETFPQAPGVYIMKDAKDRIIYIGKAINLRARVRSYFSDTHEDRPQIPIMLHKLANIEWIATNSEDEALVLEANLIRKHKPPYNLDLRDDKHYPYIKITREPFPRMLIVRRVENDGARYFGPYTDAGAMRRLVQLGKHLFKIRDCNTALPAKTTKRPCLNFSMGRCSGACAGEISESTYRENVDRLKRFLQGRRADLNAEIKAAMEQAAAHERFEEAAYLRDQLKLLAEANRLVYVDLRLTDADCDVIGLFQADRHISLAILHFREGVLIGKRNFLIERGVWEISNADHDAAIVDFYQQSFLDLPREIIIGDHGNFNVAALQTWFNTQFPGKKVSLIEAQKGARAHLVAMAEKNARLYVLQKHPPDAQADVADLQKALNLPRLPAVIEAFDISNLGASFAVAGMVQFTNGNPNKAAYRRYKIAAVEGQNDFAMIMEALSRRLKRLTDENKPLPDMLLVDGGKGQLHAAMKVLAAYQNPPMIASLAKQEEELFTPFSNEPVILAADHPARKLVQRIRDEVHRFAISYHRNLRGRQFKASALQAIKGVGPIKAQLLLKHFGSLSRVKEAPVEEIMQVQGFSQPLAEYLKIYLDKL
ncbi:MAG: excinuclease ABC subunit UvrC [Chitinivibrionales bacterium]|nr:excinuclease ABC subunit UvrC [Chitinivibrionales bacterium]